MGLTRIKVIPMTTPLGFFTIAAIDTTSTPATRENGFHVKFEHSYFNY